jgi:hypothetical protein
MSWEDEEYMPPIKSTKRKRVTKKDVQPQPNELLKQAEEVITEKANNFWSCTGPIIINNNYTQKQTIIPADPKDHWTQSKNSSEKWIHLYHIDQKITKLQNEFYRTANWELFKKIEFLNESKRILLEQGTILDPIEIDELLKLYYDGEGNIIKNYNNSYYLYTFFQCPEPGEIITEDVTRNNQKGKNGFGTYEHELY